MLHVTSGGLGTSFINVVPWLQSLHGSFKQKYAWATLIRCCALQDPIEVPDTAEDAVMLMVAQELLTLRIFKSDAEQQKDKHDEINVTRSMEASGHQSLEDFVHTFVSDLSTRIADSKNRVATDALDEQAEADVRV